MLFSVDPHIINCASAGGIATVIVDLERKGKQIRQTGFDTQIGQDTIADIEKIKTNTTAKVITRINGFWENTPTEIHEVVERGTDEIMLPMVRSLIEVKKCLELIGDRCRLGILVETINAVQLCKELSEFPLSRVYVGLNDLAIDRGLKNIFTSVADGTVEKIRKVFKQPFGFGGLTLPEAGYPIPCRLLMSEMARLNSQFSFLRRSFFRDTQGNDLSIEIPKILQAILAEFKRPICELEKDHDNFVEMVGSMKVGSVENG